MFLPKMDVAFSLYFLLWKKGIPVRMLSSACIVNQADVDTFFHDFIIVNIIVIIDFISVVINTRDVFTRLDARYSK